SGLREHLPTTALAEKFEDSHQMVILAPAGGGKSFVLDQLARDLIERAEVPVPVRLDLSSWEKDDTSLADWMAREMDCFFPVAFPDALAWIKYPEPPRLLPLLDGLDEVQEGRRFRCAQAIREFLSARGGGMVVCVRTETYGKLKKQLGFQIEAEL